MNRINNTLTNVFKAATFSLLALATIDASAAVKFRIGYEADTNNYAVYMTPDSVPSPDMLLSAQVTIIVPHGEGTNSFAVENISSEVRGINWIDNSRINAPTENKQADYISMAYYFSGSRIPAFGWVPGEEKKVFTFTSNLGCVSGVKLIDSQDPFNQLPNSASTNPGNDFMNIGWKMSNAYTGNYGDTITCDTPAVASAPAVTEPSCTPTAQDQYYQSKIDALTKLKAGASASRQQQIDDLISRLQSRMSCTA